MQYQVPQFIDMEDHIIGPLTLKQFLYLAAAGAILLIAWFAFNIFIFLITAIPVIAVSLAFAFMKINDRPFVHFVISAFNYYLKPRLYVWLPQKKPGVSLSEKPEFKPSLPPPETLSQEKITKSKIRDLALSLDIGAKKRLNQNQ